MRSHIPCARRAPAFSFNLRTQKRRRFALASALAVALLICVSVAVAADISFILKWGTTGTANGQLLTPRGIAVDSMGNVYVAEGNGNRIQKFDANGGFLLKFGVPGDVSIMISVRITFTPCA